MKPGPELPAVARPLPPCTGPETSTAGRARRVGVGSAARLDVDELQAPATSRREDRETPARARHAEPAFTAATHSLLRCSHSRMDSSVIVVSPTGYMTGRSSGWVPVTQAWKGSHLSAEKPFVR